MGMLWACMGMLWACMGVLWGCMVHGDSVHGKGWHGNHGWRVPQVREWERHSHNHGHWHGVLVWSGEAGLWEQVGLVHRASWLGRACRGGVEGPGGLEASCDLAGVLALAGGLGDSVSTGVRGLGTACAIQAKKKTKRAETWPLLPLWGLVWTWPCFWPPVAKFHCSHNFIPA